MPATVSGRGEVRLDQGPTCPAPTGGIATGERCYAVVRPEKLRIETAAGGDGGGGSKGLLRIGGTVESSLYLGTSTQLVVDLGENVRMTVLVPNASEAERQRLPGGGARVTLAWEPEHMHLVRESPQAGSSTNSGQGKVAEAELEPTKRG
jgi:ABC-type Fe3+/spermidine/putrescine transport system ATPase subunit